MDTHSEIVKQSDLINQLVLDRTTMEELGRVEVLWMYPQAHRVLGFVAKSGFLGAKKAAFKLSQVHALGESGILTRSEPESTDGDKVSQLESLLNHELWSEAGNKLGKITDCLFHLRTGTITHYLFVSNGWGGITGEVYQLPPAQIVSFSKKRVLVAEIAETTFTLYREGISQKFTKTTDLLKEEATQEWRSLTKRAETATERAKGRLQSLADQAKEQAQLLSQKAKEKAQLVNEQLKENRQTWVEQAREKSQTLANQVKEHTQTLGKQVEEGIQTLTVHAEEIFDSTEPSASTGASSSSDNLDDELDIFDDDFDDNDWISPPPNSPNPPAQTIPDDSTLENTLEDDVWVSPSSTSPSATEPATGDIPDDDDDEPWI